MDDPKINAKVAEYEEMMRVWVDEASDLVDGFKSLFPKTTEGIMKYLFAVNFMVTEECMKRGIPTERFTEAVPTVVGFWWKAGKPEGGEFMVVSAANLEELEERIKKMQEGGGEKPSSSG